MVALESVCDVAVLPAHVCSPCELEGGITTGTPVALNNGVMDATGPAAPVRFSLWDPLDGDREDLGRPAITDDFMIVKMEGYIDLIPYFVPTWTSADCAGYESGPTCDQIRYAMQYDNYILRAAIVKDKFIASDRYFTGPNDTAGWVAPTRDPLNTEEWVDGRFAKQWQKSWFNITQNTFKFYDSTCSEIIGVCADTTGSISGGGSSNSILTDGSGTIDGNDPVTGTIGTVCSETVGSGWGGMYSQFLRPAKVRINLNSRRKFRMQESEGLSVWVNYTARSMLTASGIPAPFRQGAVGFYAAPTVRMLVELP